MKAGMKPLGGFVAVALLVGAAPASAQTELEDVVQLARTAWLQHDAGALVAHSDTVRLRIPGVAASASLQPEQASRLLARYLEPSQERGFDLVGLRRLAEDHAYAEIARRYVVKGTDDELVETVFFGFRRLSGAWRLREVRVTP